MAASMQNPLVTVVALQFLLHALGWAMAAWMLKPQRRTLLHWSAFFACVGIGFGLVTLRSDDRTWLAFNGASMCWHLGLLLLWRGIEVHLGMAHRHVPQATLLIGLLGLHAWVGPSAEYSGTRVVLAYTANAAIVVAMMAGLQGPLRARHGLRIALMLALPALVILVAFVGLALRQVLAASQGLEIHVVDAPVLGSVYAYLAAAAVFNVSFMALVVGQLLARLRQLSERDPLTNLYNRRALRERVVEQWKRWQRFGDVFSVVSLDLDHFKQINDRHGHAAGDAVLVHVAQRLRSMVRGHDVVARVGGEEFLVLMPGADLRAAHHLGMRLRQHLADEPVVAASTTLRITTSIGVAEVHRDDADAEPVLRRADQALYRAKATGRDRVCGLPDREPA
jgi:diguanylate cyclase (GGDEF)-like protein